MSISIEEAKAFIQDAKKSRENWLVIAERSWNELKKRQKNGKIWSAQPNYAKRRSRYPAWYSIFKIRQPLLLSRIGIPIGKDTTQDGNDNVGATAAICLERLATNLAKSFDFFDVACSGRDDFLATNFGICRAYYERDIVKQEVKERLQPQKVPGGEDVVFVDGEGKIIESDDIGQDDEGYFLEHEEVVDVENERVCLEPVLYKDVYVDPDIRRWNRCKRLAFCECYSEREFKEIFGVTALSALSKPESGSQDESAPKRPSIKVYEYWDSYEKEVLWFAENGLEFIKPKDYYLPNDEDENKEQESVNGLYDLEKFFPVPDPLLTNAPTDEFWPTPEYIQILDILEDIHTLFSRLVAATRAFRARLLFDDNIEGLKEAMAEATEGDAFGVTNLTQALSTAGGTLEGVVQYIPTGPLVESVNNLYTALDQRLGALFRLTGTSDLLQGLSQSESGKTLGERQMEEKYAINQIAEPQRKMQEYVRGMYQLLCEMALKNFKDASLDMYIMPATMQKEDQDRYRAALGMLKENQKRFRIELETDSTIALNETYDKSMRLELVNALTSALEKTADVNGPLQAVELHALKYLVQGFRQGKMFQNEITQAIDNVIEQAKSAPPAFNKEESDAKIEQARLQLEQMQLQLEQGKAQGTNQIEMMKAQSTAQLAAAKLNQDGMLASVANQLEQFKAQMAAGKDSATLQLSYAQLNADISKAQQELALKRDELMVEIRKVSSAEEADKFGAMVDMQLKPQQAQIEQYKLQIDAAELRLREQDQALKAQEQQFQAYNTQMDNERQAQRLEIDKASLMHEMTKPSESPVHMNVDARFVPVAKKTEVTKDKYGNVRKFKNTERPVVEGR